MNGKRLRCLVLFRLKIDCFRTVVWHNGGLPHEYMVLFSRIHSDILLFYPSIKKLWRTLVKSKRKKTYLIWRAFYFSFHVLGFGTKPPRVRVRTMFKNLWNLCLMQKGIRSTKRFFALRSRMYQILIGLIFSDSIKCLHIHVNHVKGR